MSKPLDKRVKKILEELEFDPKECLWDCHGTWVMYHRFVEIAGAKHKVRYDLTEVETNSKEGIVCVKCVAGIEDDDCINVVTYGEASPKNNKNAYPYAMAEKRAVDRAILKLLGLHGFIYSEDELDASQFKGEKDKEERHHPNKETYEELNEANKMQCNNIAGSIVDHFSNDNEDRALDLVFTADNDIKQGVAYVLYNQTGDNKINNRLRRLSQERHLRESK